MATAKEKLTALANTVREMTGEKGPLSIDKMTQLLSHFKVSGIADGWDMGELTLSENIIGNESDEGYAIPHKLGKIPNFVLIWLNDPQPNGRNQWRAVLKCNIGDDIDGETGEVSPKEFYSVGMRMSNYTHSTTTLDTYGLDSTEVFYLPFYGNTYYKTGSPYKWLAFRIEE